MLFRSLLGFEGGVLFDPMWTIAAGPFAEGTLFDFLKGLFGWSADPERIRVATYIAYLVPVLWVFLRPDRPTNATEASPVEGDEALVDA